MKRLAIILTLCAASAIVSAAVHHVPTGFPTIQAALNACGAGDTVLVQAGTYNENISWPSVAAIKLLSAGDSSNTLINGANSGRVVEFSSGVIDTNTVVSGFTITGGYVTGSSAQGAGIRISGASPRIERSVITGNHLNAGNWGYGAGVYCNNSSAVFHHVSISGNSTDSASWGYGGGMHLTGSGHPVMRNVLIQGNSVRSDSWNYGTGVYCKIDSATFLNVIIADNVTGDSASWYYGTGIYIDDCAAALTNVLIKGNMMANGGNWYYGAGVYVRQSSGTAAVTMNAVTVTENMRSSGSITGAGLYANSGTMVDIRNSISWNVNSGAEIDGPGLVTAAYCDIRGGMAGTGNINLLPLFQSPTDYHLLPGSPGIDAGDTSTAPPFDLENMPRPLPAGSNPDMGCYETNQSSVSTGEIPGHAQLLLYPNPAQHRVTLEWPGERPHSMVLTLVDLFGREAGTTICPTGFCSVDISHLPAGTYFFLAMDEQRRLLRQRLVIH